MAQFSKLVITKAGQALIAKILAGTASNVEFTKVAASKAEYNVDELELLTALPDIMQEVEISYKARTNDVAVTIETAFSNHKLTVGYNMNTIGLFAVDPDDGEILYAACVELSGYCYMPPFNGITVSGALVKLITTVGNADSISLEVNPAVTVTVADLERLQKRLDEILSAKQNKLTGAQGQIVGFDKDGNPIAQAAQTTVTGNAGTATKLKTARKIGSASFDGSADITLAQIGAAAADHTHPAQTTVTGNAGTATKLATARTIRTKLASTTAASFDGSGNVTPGVSGILPVANGGTGNNSGYITKGQESGTTAGLRATIEGIHNTVTGSNAHAEGKDTTASGAHAHTEGYGTTASNDHAHAEGCDATASGFISHAEGNATVASATHSHAEGRVTKASGFAAHSEGDSTTASGSMSHSEGGSTTASGDLSHAEGSGSTAAGNLSHAGGDHTIAEYPSETAVGRFNVKKSPASNNTLGDLFVVGKGTEENARANVLRINSSGVYGTASFNATGADYAELFEWMDGNPDKEDRAGRFVTLDGEKIRLAGPGDDFILGIISGNPSVVGDVHDDQWQGMFLYDIYGRPIWEDVEVPAQTEEVPDPEDPEKTITRVIVPAHVEHRQKINPDYDSGQKYIPRTERPEWGCVGMMGKLVVIDDGTCEANGWCKPGEGGAATASAERTDFRVMARIDATHVRVLMLGRR